MTLRRLATLPLLLLIAVLASGCGERVEPTGSPKPESLRLMLDYFPNADHAGIYAAQAGGDFAKAGLNVEIQTPSDPSAPLKLLAAGKVDLAISYQPELMLARDKGQQLVAVGALVQKPLTSIISAGKKAVHTPAQLAGKTVGTAGIPYQSAYLKAILAKANVDPSSVKEVNVGFNLVPAILSGRVDATLGAFWNYEGVDLLQRHKNPSIIRLDRAGVPTYNELIIVARAQDLRSHGERVRRFMRALALGHEALRKDPNAGVDPLLKANKDLQRPLQEASVKATLPAFFPGGGKPFGYMDPAQWRAYGDWMLRNKLIKLPANPNRELTNEFLPGQGLAGTNTRTPTP
ncbi:MAG: ABC transporter substrate-binding protein [Solirubrobacteraceae bacterium]